MSHDKHFIKATLIVAACSFLSRILGLLRSTLLSSFFGATKSDGLTDCYAASFKLPDIIFNLVVFGIISIILIPYFSGLIKKENYEKLQKSVSSFLNLFFLLLTGFIIIGFVFAPFIVKNFLVKGWTNIENINLTIKMTRILFLQMFFMSMSGIFGSFLNSLEKFTAYSFAILTYNIGIIFGIIFLTPFMGIEGAAWGAVLGSFLQFLIQMLASFRSGFRYSFVLPKMNKEIKELFTIAVPRIIALGGEQFVKFAIVNIASFLFVGSIFIFENAENFSMVPFGMIAVSVSTTAFPVFSKLYIEGNFTKLTNSLLDKLRFCMFFMLPVTGIMMIFSREIIELLLVYKKFSQQDAVLTANAMIYYMTGIPFFSITIILVKFYYAQKKSVTPMIVTLITVTATVILSYYLAKPFQITGLSIARSASYFIQTALLIFFLALIYKKEKIQISIEWKIIFDTLKIFLVTALVCTAGFIINENITFSIRIKLDAILKITILGASLSLFYFLALYFLRIPEAQNIRKLIKKKLKI